MAIDIGDLYKQKSEINEIKPNCKEAHERLKIARGYYATFLHASRLLDKPFLHQIQLTTYKEYPSKSRNSKPMKYGSHQVIYMSLQRSKISNLLEIGLKLEAYHILRKKADYDLNVEITDDDIVQAEDFFNDCKKRIDFYISNGKKEYIDPDDQREAIRVDEKTVVMRRQNMKIAQ